MTTDTDSERSEAEVEQDDLPTAEEAPDTVQEYTWDSENGDFAFICPRCEKHNDLNGDPTDFANKPFRCLGCDYVPLLDAEGLEEFADTEDDDGGN